MRSLKTIFLVAFLLAAATGLAACFKISLADGKVRCSSDVNNLCPEGYSCYSGYCYTKQPDSGVDAEEPGDGG